MVDSANQLQGDERQEQTQKQPLRHDTRAGAVSFPFLRSKALLNDSHQLPWRQTWLDSACHGSVSRRDLGIIDCDLETIFKRHDDLNDIELIGPYRRMNQRGVHGNHLGSKAQLLR